METFVPNLGVVIIVMTVCTMLNAAIVVALSKLYYGAIKEHCTNWCGVFKHHTILGVFGMFFFGIPESLVILDIIQGNINPVLWVLYPIMKVAFCCMGEISYMVARDED